MGAKNSSVRQSATEPLAEGAPVDARNLLIPAPPDPGAVLDGARGVVEAWATNAPIGEEWREAVLRGDVTWADAVGAWRERGDTFLIEFGRFREAFVNGLLRAAAASIAGKRAPQLMAATAPGSRLPTSDYDVTMSGLGAARVVRRFHDAFDAAWLGATSSDVFDANAYFSGYFERVHSGRYAAAYQQSAGGAGRGKRRSGRKGKGKGDDDGGGGGGGAVKCDVGCADCVVRFINLRDDPRGGREQALFACLKLMSSAWEWRDAHAEFPAGSGRGPGPAPRLRWYDAAHAGAVLSCLHSTRRAHASAARVRRDTWVSSSSDPRAPRRPSPYENALESVERAQVRMQLAVEEGELREAQLVLKRAVGVSAVFGDGMYYTEGAFFHAVGVLQMKLRGLPLGEQELLAAAVENAGDMLHAMLSAVLARAAAGSRKSSMSTVAEVEGAAEMAAEMAAEVAAEVAAADVALAAGGRNAVAAVTSDDDLDVGGDDFGGPSGSHGGVCAALHASAKYAFRSVDALVRWDALVVAEALALGAGDERDDGLTSALRALRAASDVCLLARAGPAVPCAPDSPFCALRAAWLRAAAAAGAAGAGDFAGSLAGQAAGQASAPASEAAPEAAPRSDVALFFEGAVAGTLCGWADARNKDLPLGTRRCAFPPRLSLTDIGVDELCRAARSGGERTPVLQSPTSRKRRRNATTLSAATAQELISPSG